MRHPLYGTNPVCSLILTIPGNLNFVSLFPQVLKSPLKDCIHSSILNINLDASYLSNDRSSLQSRSVFVGNLVSLNVYCFPTQTFKVLTPHPILLSCLINLPIINLSCKVNLNSVSSWLAYTENASIERRKL